MTNEELQPIIIEIIENIAPDHDVSKLDPNVSLRDQLDLDSMDFLDLVRQIRIKLNIDVPAEDFPKLKTLNSATIYLQSKF